MFWKWLKHVYIFFSVFNNETIYMLYVPQILIVFFCFVFTLNVSVFLRVFTTHSNRFYLRLFYSIPDVWNALVIFFSTLSFLIQMIKVITTYNKLSRAFYNLSLYMMRNLHFYFIIYMLLILTFIETNPRHYRKYNSCFSKQHSTKQCLQPFIIVRYYLLNYPCMTVLQLVKPTSMTQLTMKVSIMMVFTPYTLW